MVRGVWSLFYNHMRPGYFLLHRKCLTPESFKDAERTLAWIDFVSLANYETGIVTASYGFLASRWNCSKATAYRRVEHWIKQKQAERCTERDAERDAERFLLLNYAKYQNIEERTAERVTERDAEQMKRSKEKLNKEKKDKPNGLSSDADRMSAKKLLVALINKNESFAVLPDKAREAKVRAWAEDISKLRRIDQMPTEKIDMMIEWLFTSNHKDAVFWSKNILSGDKLRKHFPRLVGAMEREHQDSKSSFLFIS